MTTNSPVDIGTLIVSRPGVNGGRPCIVGTGLSVHAIAVRYQRGETPEYIADDAGGDIPLSHIHAAITYYLANRALIDAQLAADRELNDRLAAEHPRSSPATPAGG